MKKTHDEKLKKARERMENTYRTWQKHKCKRNWERYEKACEDCEKVADEPV